MTPSLPVLQIVPRRPGSRDGVGDYALTVARKLCDRFNCNTLFAASRSVGEADGFPIQTAGEFEIVRLSAPLEGTRFEHTILHYVNYGYHKRGVPTGLLAMLRQLREQSTGQLVTVFHELYASGPPWKSAFWLLPFQISIAKAISRLSDTCIVSSETMMGQLRKLTPSAIVRVHPVPSNFGEPAITTAQLASRSPYRWVICGGTIMVERALQSFRTNAGHVPPDFSPRELIVLGGDDNPRIRQLLKDLPSIRSEYHPRASIEGASKLLESCSFAWIDYFHRAGVPTDAILKSGAFAAACAHGVIPIFPHPGSVISLKDDRLPGPFFVNPRSHRLPDSGDRTTAAIAVYNWYQRHASSENLVRGIANVLQLQPSPQAAAAGNAPIQ